MNCRFDAAAHTYFAGDRELPSVTRILSATGLYKDLSFLRLGPEYQQRGHAVHNACRLVDQGKWNPAGKHADVIPYADAYAEFKKLTGFVGRVWELPMYDTKAGYAGTLDCIGTVPNGEIWLPDLKTGTLPYWVGAQLAGYELLLAHGFLDFERAQYVDIEWMESTILLIKRKSLNLDGKSFRLRSHDEPRSMMMWRAALMLYKGREEGNLL